MVLVIISFLIAVFATLYAMDIWPFEETMSTNSTTESSLALAKDSIVKNVSSALENTDTKKAVYNVTGSVENGYNITQHVEKNVSSTTKILPTTLTDIKATTVAS
ncbi:hypothetical protein NEAUS04_1193, partial [Nematocida ausubeli]